VKRKKVETFQQSGRRGGLIGGRSTSEAKTEAARENGKLGGRPRKDGSR